MLRSVTGIQRISALTGARLRVRGTLRLETQATGHAWGAEAAARAGSRAEGRLSLAGHLGLSEGWLWRVRWACACVCVCVCVCVHVHLGGVIQTAAGFGGEGQELAEPAPS